MCILSAGMYYVCRHVAHPFDTVLLRIMVVKKIYVTYIVIHNNNNTIQSPVLSTEYFFIRAYPPKAA